MTTIVCRGRVMAADSRITCEGVVIGGQGKLARLASGAIFGAAGDTDTRELRRVLSGGAMPTRAQLVGAICEDVEALLLMADGVLWKIEANRAEHFAQMFELKADYAAIGSGASFALGALAHGATAAAAVKCAVKHDPKSGPPVVALRLRSC